MKRCKHRLTGQLMALGLAAALPSMADEVVAYATGGWFAVDSREVKDTTLSGGVIVGGATNVVLRSSPNAWGEAGGGASATITWASAAGGSGTVAAETTAEEVEWTPAVRSGTNTLTYVSGSVQKTAKFRATYLKEVPLGGDAVATIRDGVCTINGDASYAEPTAERPLWNERSDFTRVVVNDATTIGKNAFSYFKNVNEVEIGGTVTTIGEDAFFFCPGLRSVYIGANVQSIGANAFDCCNSLTHVQAANLAVVQLLGGTFRNTTRITMVGGEPKIDMVPVVDVDGYNRVLKGKASLDDAGTGWDTIADEGDIDAKYHFFKYEYEAK